MKMTGIKKEVESFCVICKREGKDLKGSLESVVAHVAKEHGVRETTDSSATHYVATVGQRYYDKDTGKESEYAPQTG